MPPAIHRTMTESAVGAGAVARTSLGSAPISDANVAAAVTPLLMKPRRPIFAPIKASSLVNPAVNLVSTMCDRPPGLPLRTLFMTLSSYGNILSLTNELKLGTHHDGPKQI